MLRCIRSEAASFPCLGCDKVFPSLPQLNGHQPRCSRSKFRRQPASLGTAGQNPAASGNGHHTHHSSTIHRDKRSKTSEVLAVGDSQAVPSDSLGSSQAAGLRAPSPPQQDIASTSAVQEQVAGAEQIHPLAAASEVQPPTQHPRQIPLPSSISGASTPWSVARAPEGVVHDLQPAYDSLTGAELDLLPILFKLPQKDRHTLLHKYLSDVRWRSSRELDDFLVPEADWRHEVVFEHVEHKFHVYIRDDASKNLYDLFDYAEKDHGVPRKYEPFYDRSGRAAYTSIENGRRMRTVAKWVKEDFGGNANPLFFYLYSDASQVITIRDGFSFHRVILFLVSKSAQQTRKKTNYITAGWIPTLSPQSVGVTREEWESDKWVAIRQCVFRVSMTAILRDLKAAGYSGKVLLSGETVVPVLAAFTCDMMEEYPLKGQGGPASKFNSLKTLTPNGKLADIDNADDWPRRTQAAAEQVRREANAAEERGDPELALRLLKDHGLQATTTDPPLAGFRYVDYTQICAPDRMHIDLILTKMLKAIQRRLLPKDLQYIRDYFKGEWVAKAPPDMPKGGLDALAHKMTANQIVALAKALIVPLGKVDSGAAETLAGYMEWRLVRDAPQHSEADLEQMKVCRLRFQRLALEYFPEIIWGRTPKFEAMREFEVSIRELGNVEATSTDYGERTHKDVKAVYPFTNHHPEAMLEQVRRQVELRSAAARLVSAAQNYTILEQYNTMKRSATRTGEAATTATFLCDLSLTALLYRDADAIQFAAPANPVTQPQALLRDRPELCGEAGLYPYLKEHLGLPALGALPLGRVYKDQLRVRKAMAILAKLHRGCAEEATTLTATEAEKSTVAVWGKDSDGNHEEWFAQLQLIFTYRTKQDSSILCAFVRWYEPVELGLPGHRMTCLHFAPGDVGPRYSVINANTVARPVVLQAHPTSASKVVYNHFFCTS